jgi:hypothetical protein
MRSIPTLLLRLACVIEFAGAAANPFSMLANGLNSEPLKDIDAQLDLVKEIGAMEAGRKLKGNQ